MEWNPIGEEGATILLNALRNGNTSITELNLGSCGVSLATQRCASPVDSSMVRGSSLLMQNFASKGLRKQGKHDC